MYAYTRRESQYHALSAAGLMQASKIGGGNAADSASETTAASGREAGGNVAYHSRRTSFNMVCDSQVLAAHPKLDKSISDMQV